MKKRILSVILMLGVIMSCNSIGISVNAETGQGACYIDTDNDGDFGTDEIKYDTIAEAIEATGTEETTIRLVDSVSEHFEIASTQNITLDLNGNVLKGDGSGSSVIMDKGILTVKNGTISDNTSKGNGGAIQTSSGATLLLYDVTIKNCNSDKSGGAIFCAYNSQVLLSGCVLKDNYATKDGGAICIEGGVVGSADTDKLALIDTTISGNVAGETGGGVFYENTIDTCFVKGTPISMADGTTKNVEDIVVGDEVKTFDHEKGEFSSSKVYITFGEPVSYETIFELNFEDGTRLSLVASHDLLEKESRKYKTFDVYNAEDYVGQSFFGEDGKWHKLTSVSYGEKTNWHYEIYTEKHQNCFANNMLTVPTDVDYLLNIYELDEGLKADETRLAADIEKYGLATFDYISENYGLSYDWYDASCTKYIFVAIGKGFATLEAFEALYATTDDFKSDNSNQIDNLSMLESAPVMLLSNGTATPKIADYTANYLSIDGDTKITGNIADSKTNNVYLAINDDSNNSLIMVGSNIGDACVGVTTETEPTDSEPVTFTNDSAEGALQYFFSDNGDYCVKYKESKYLELAVPVPEFASSSDSGYYATTSTGSDESGIISFTSLFSNLTTDFANYSFSADDSFGIIVYNAADGIQNSSLKCEKTDFSALSNANGYFYSFVNDIETTNFDKSVYAIPFAMINGKATWGSIISNNVNQDKWLGDISNSPVE